MLNQKEIFELIEDLTDEDASFRAATLKVLWEYPSADLRVLPYLEQLLNDKTPCILAIPYVFGEIRPNGKSRTTDQALTPLIPLVHIVRGGGSPERSPPRTCWETRSG